MEGTYGSKVNRIGVYTKLTGFFLSVSALFGVAATAQAATMFPSPGSGTYDVGKTFSVSVLVSSTDKAMNAASGVISFPSDKLEVTSVSKSGSIITLWVQEPSFSNSAGTISYEGIVLNPGFQKANGKIISVSFKVKASGTAQIKFTSGAVLANDGLGTNILSGLGSAQYTLGEAAAPTPTEPTPPPATGTPSAPKITSTTHPDPNKWYSKNEASFAWPLPSGITADRLLFGKLPTAEPSVTYTPPVSGKQIPGIEDGIWYFTVQLRNGKGWGEISHFRFQVDTTKPSSLTVTEVPREDTTEPKAIFSFEAMDELSGIDHYEVKIDSGNSVIWNDNGSHRYETAFLESGTHTIYVSAVDKAGNALTTSAQFSIKAINAPTITEYPKQLRSDQPFIVRGTTYPNGKVTLWLQKGTDEPKSFSLTADQNGAFTYTSESPLSDGDYKLWAEVTDPRGAKSPPSAKVSVTVSVPAPACVKTVMADILTIAVPLIALVFILLLVLWYAWHKIFATRKRLRGEVREAESTLHSAFSILRGDIRAQIRMLEKARTKRELTLEEEKIIKNLKHDLDVAEKFVKKELSNIEKVMK
jgi:hypothetical protein